MENTTTRAISTPVAPSASTSAIGSRLGPRLPVGVRVLLPALLLLPAAAASALPALLPGVAAALNRPDAGGAAAYALVCATSLLAYALIAVLLVRLVDRRPLAALGLRPGARAVGALLLGVLVSVLAMGAAAVVGGLTGIARPLPDEVLEQATTASVPLAVTLSVLLLRAFVLQGIGEELLFRGYLLQTLSRRPFFAVLISAVAFTIPHLASGGGQQGVGERLVYLAMPFGFALSAGLLAIALRSVWAAIGIHGGFHIANGLAGALGLHVDGLGAWVLLGSAHVLAAVLISVLIPRRRWAQVREQGPYSRGTGDPAA